MPIMETVTVDESQFPEAVQRDLLECWRRREVLPKFHYETYRQARHWLALHEAHSPARRDPECAAIYDRAFAATGNMLTEAGARVVGLGCGGGQKDARLIQILASHKAPLSYLPCDASMPLVLTAQHAVEAVLPGICCDPLVCDLGRCEDLAQSIDRVAGQTGLPGRRIFTFFGMIPNFDPGFIFPRLRKALGAEDWLLCSANLAPGQNYRAGVEAVLPGYDNDLTREWLFVFLNDCGVERDHGEIRFGIEEDGRGFLRIVANFCIAKRIEVAVLGEKFEFKEGDKILLFYSYRYQPAQVEGLLRGQGMEAAQQWMAPSVEEGVFLCRRHS